MNAAISRTHLPKEVASALGISVDTVGRYAREGLIPFDTTPKGHRRYNIDETQAALASELTPRNRLQGPPPGRRNRLVAGPDIVPSPQSALREQLRSVRTTEKATLPESGGSESRNPGSAFDEVLGHAKRVLVASA
ncbi:MerR family DNA-binding transcriptional regulator [Arthrobacter sp. M2012083]|uniref:MerR family DNA-binding transcriptional regulator n=1 Tax=Arthrobacter sp. M2012083 TaxID=1197706 RepID=UPI000305F3A7|nr:MerR family DNA-binding transcriptional regulator [Arthrobacter sp. M2012083]